MSKLYILAGLAASGKSTIAPMLVARAKSVGNPVVWIDPDLLFAPIEEVVSATLLEFSGDKKDERLMQHIAMGVEKGLLTSVRNILDGGNTVLLTHPFGYYLARGIEVNHAFEAFMGKGHHEVHVLWLDVPVEMLAQRMHERLHLCDRKHLQNFKEYTKLLSSPIMQKMIHVRNTGTAEDAVVKINNLWNLF